MKIAVIHGPNLDRLGVREPAVYGTMTLAEINERVVARAREMGLEVMIQQFDGEGDIVRAIHCVQDDCAAIVINPGAYSHYSLAIADAIRAATTPVVEVHLSNIYSREGFRAQMVTAAACRAFIAGFGGLGYLLALEGAAALACACEVHCSGGHCAHQSVYRS